MTSKQVIEIKGRAICTSKPLLAVLGRANVQLLKARISHTFRCKVRKMRNG
jgi:hypothetical protein